MISHGSLFWQQSPSPRQAGQMCDDCGDSLTSQGSLLSVPAPVPMIPAVAAVPGFSLASGDAQHLTPKASCSSVWLLASSEGAAGAVDPQPSVAVPSLGMSQPHLTVWLFSMFPLLALTYVG